MCIYIYMYICTNIYVYQGERWLRPEYRESGLLNLHKTSRIEFFPVGLVGAIVPWNYPFHNVFNPLVAAVFAGNTRAHRHALTRPPTHTHVCVCLYLYVCMHTRVCVCVCVHAYIHM